MFVTKHQEYNGWNSFETWKVMHDHFNDMDLEQLESHFFERDRYCNADLARSYIEMILEDSNELYIVESFLDCVDWQEVERAIECNYEDFKQYA
tara:strand:+ start:982 stop:1263 length:282 start_codon:yes stop_codon:yes gene_type:complete